MWTGNVWLHFKMNISAFFNAFLVLFQTWHPASCIDIHFVKRIYHKISLIFVLFEAAVSIGFAKTNCPICFLVWISVRMWALASPCYLCVFSLPRWKTEQRCMGVCADAIIFRKETCATSLMTHQPHPIDMEMKAIIFSGFNVTSGITNVELTSLVHQAQRINVRASYDGQSATAQNCCRWRGACCYHIRGEKTPPGVLREIYCHSVTLPLVITVRLIHSKERLSCTSSKLLTILQVRFLIIKPDF